MIPPPPHDLVRAVRAELATPGRYHLETPHGVHRSWLAIAFAWLAQRYSDFVHALAARVHVGPRGVSLFGDLIVVACVVIIGIVGARLLIALQIERSQRAQARALTPARSAVAFVRRAREAAELGDYSKAVRLLFAAAVTLLDLRGVVHDDASATINELRREVRARGESVELPFVEIARVYTAAAYAEESLDARSFDQAVEAYDRLAEAVAPV